MKGIKYRFYCNFTAIFHTVGWMDEVWTYSHVYILVHNQTGGGGGPGVTSNVGRIFSPFLCFSSRTIRLIGGQTGDRPKWWKWDSLAVFNKKKRKKKQVRATQNDNVCAYMDEQKLWSMIHDLIHRKRLRIIRDLSIFSVWSMVIQVIWSVGWAETLNDIWWLIEEKICPSALWIVFWSL